MIINSSVTTPNSGYMKCLPLFWIKQYKLKNLAILAIISEAAERRHFTQPRNVGGKLSRNYAGNSDLKMKFVTRRKFTKQKRENWNRQQKSESWNLTINRRKTEA